MSSRKPTAANLRAEMARYLVSRTDIAVLLNMHPNSVSNYLGSGYRRLPAWVAHNLGYAMNKLTNRKLFNVDMEHGLLPPPPPSAPRKKIRRTYITPLSAEAEQELLREAEKIGT